MLIWIWHLCIRNRGYIFLICYLKVHQVASLLLWHIQVHDCCDHPSPNPQELGGVHFGPTNGILSLLYTTKKSKKYNKFGNVINACSSIYDVKVEWKFDFFCHIKSTFSFDVQVVGRNIYKQLIWAN